MQLDDTRLLSNDWVIRYDTRYFQVARQSHQAPARSTVLVREAVTGAIEIRYRGSLMRWSEIPAPLPKRKPVPVAAQPAAAAGRVPSRPSADHPWRRGYVERQQRTVELGRVSDEGLWTLPAPWTRRRAHRALQNAPTRFAQRPQAITQGTFLFR